MILKDLRVRAGITQEVVAKKLDVSVNTIANWEKGGNITKGWLHKLLDLYHVNDRDSVILEVYRDDREDCAEKISNDEGDNFPYFYYEEMGMGFFNDFVRKTKLSEEEIEVCLYIKKMENEKGVPEFLTDMDNSFIEAHGGLIRVGRILGRLNLILGTNYIFEHPVVKYLWSKVEDCEDDFSYQSFLSRDDGIFDLIESDYDYGFRLPFNNTFDISKMDKYYIRCFTEYLEGYVPSMLIEDDYLPYKNIDKCITLSELPFFLWLFENPRYLGDSVSGLLPYWSFGIEYMDFMCMYEDKAQGYALAAGIVCEEREFPDGPIRLRWVLEDNKEVIDKRLYTFMQLLEFGEHSVMKDEKVIKEYWLSLTPLGHKMLDWVADDCNIVNLKSDEYRDLDFMSLTFYDEYQRDLQDLHFDDIAKRDYIQKIVNHESKLRKYMPML